MIPNLLSLFTLTAIVHEPCGRLNHTFCSVIYRVEHFQKYCSHSETKKAGAVFLGFGVVFEQSQGILEPAPSPKPRQKSEPDGPSKILAPNGYRISSNARGLDLAGLKCILRGSILSTFGFRGYDPISLYFNG
jgi:hypothetical protein